MRTVAITEVAVARNRKFETISLQRGVHCEPAMPKERHLISHRGSRDCCAQRLGAAAMVETERMAGSARREAK
jgi:hypothetical protein